MPHRAAVLAAMLLLGAACGPAEKPAGPVDAGVEEKPVDQRPTEEQEKALANLLHESHLESEEEEIKCRACHAISGKEKVQPKHRCLDCHEDNTSAVHRNVENEEARQCLTCHDFMSEVVDPWACAGCHVEDAKDTSTLQDLPDAPMVEVHGKETCNSCHVPHGEEAIELGSCIECHEEVKIHHEEADLTEPKQCMTCHGGHEVGAAAKDKCATCHDEVTRAATFEGHDQCVTCHTVHEDRKVKACKSCHDDQQTLASHESKDHAQCTSCHAPHRPSTTPKNTCDSCHDTVKPKHPADDKQGTCVGCHPQHPYRGRLVPARTCAGSDCHEVATETAHHSGLNCRECHMEHDFEVEAPTADTCQRCHVAKAPEATKITALTPAAVNPVDGHQFCLDCHVDASHTPTKPTADCAECHEEQKAQITRGHEDCADCHAPHEGTVGKSCVDCHADQLGSRHDEEEDDCSQCHRPHGPEGPAEPKACTSCHDQALPALHAVEDHKQCIDCHDFHDKRPQKGRTMCLESCHQDMIDHEPTAKSCVGCHPFEEKEAEE